MEGRLWLTAAAVCRARFFLAGVQRRGFQALEHRNVHVFLLPFSFQLAVQQRPGCVAGQGPGSVDWRSCRLRRLIATHRPSTGTLLAVMTGAQAWNQRCFFRRARTC
jgi:hypothetical protein